MLERISIGCFAVAVLAFAWGFTTEYRQSRQGGPVAIVATLPFGAQAALLITIGVATLKGRAVPPWAYLLLFLGLCVACGFAISSASARRDS